jgi:NAD-dependent deacetylase
MKENIEKAARLIRESKHPGAFTGAGISVESGIPPFRGENGLWAKYDPMALDLQHFYQNPLESWRVIKEIFYDFFGKAKPNRAHEVLAWMEQNDLLEGVVTQNIDNLHQEAGCTVVHEFHGNSRRLECTRCKKHYEASLERVAKIPPTCDECQGMLKPDFIFFGEGIPPDAYNQSMALAERADVFLVIGTTGEVMPANMVPQVAKQNGATIIEINPEKSLFTGNITDIFLQGKASQVLDDIFQLLKY